MRGKILGGFLIIAILVGTLPAFASPPGPKYRPIDVGPRLRGMGPSDVTLHINGYEEEYEDSSRTSEDVPDYYGEGDIILALWYDDVTGLYLASYEVRAIGEHIEVWVMTNLDFPGGDPRNPVVVTDEQIDYLVSEFDNNIYPKEVEFFGPPDFHDGSNAALPFGYYDPEGRTIAMISNIGDENYYDPDYPLYIAGFYWGSVFEFYLDRNVISIDAFDWVNRVGPDAERPFLYEGVFAHEYQHLLHDDYDSAEENWINEGLSDWAEWLTGYGIPESHVGAAASNPENSLVAWGDQGGLEILTDYGLAYLYQEYMYQNFGEDFIKTEFLDSANQGISSVDAVLAGLGATETFADTFHSYSAALYTSGAFDLEALQDFQVDVGHPGKRNPEAYATAGAPPWGTDYILFWGDSRIANLEFNGLQFNPTPWTSDGEVLFSGAGDLLDNWAVFEAYVDPGDPNLVFDTSYVIEADYDFGFVQVSTDGGETWSSLQNTYTTFAHAPDALPKAIANLPGLTGDSGGWVNMSFDLTTYGGQNILLAFRYVTDWAFVEPGWYVDDVSVSGSLISDGSDASVFKDLNEVLGKINEFTVTLIGERNRKGEPEYKVETILTGNYMTDWDEIRDVFKNYRHVVMLVTYDAEEGVTAYAEYDYELFSNGGKPFKKK